MLHRCAAACGFVLLAAGLASAQSGGDKAKADSPIVAKTRTKLDTPVTVDFKDEALKEAIKELGKQTEISIRLDLAGGVSGNQQFTYKAENKPLREALEEMFKGRGLGYIIHRKANANDRYEGYLDIVQGDQRGDPVAAGGKEPPKGDAGKSKSGSSKSGTSKPPAKSDKGDKTDKPDEQERLAGSKLRNARLLADDPNTIKVAREFLEEIIAKYPDTKAAGEAKQLLEKLKSKG